MEKEVLPGVTRLQPSELAGSRARIYKVLSITYSKPADEQLVELLRAWATLETELPPGILPGLMKLGLKKMGNYLVKVSSPPSAELLAALGTEFTRLFRGLNRWHSPPPPYESVYLNDGMLYGPSTDRVAQQYRRFQLKGQDNEPPDHIALELDFMRFLCDREAQAWQTGKGGQDWLKEEDVFMSEHLSRWVPAFCENIRKFDITGFYKGLAEVTQGWIYCDQRLVTSMLK